jgi:hypothetical protein
MEDKELMAAVGQVVVDSATLEYFAAVLVAMTEGHRDQDCENRALALVKNPGEAMGALKAVARARPEQPGFMRLWHDARAVLEDRNVIVHAVPLEVVRVGAEGGLIGWVPRKGREIEFTTSAVLDHSRDIRIACRRFHEAIAAESSASPSGI